MESSAPIRHGIRWKLLVTMLSLIFGLLAVLSWIEIRADQRLIERELERRVSLMREVLVARGEGAASQLAKEVGNHIAGFAFSAVSELVTNATRLNPHLSYALVMNTNAQALAHAGAGGALIHFDGELKQYSGGDDRFAAGQTNSGARNVTVQKAEVLEVIAPVIVGTERWGVLRLGYSLEGLRREIESSRREMVDQVQAVITRSIATAAGMMVVGLIAIAWLSGLISQPIQRLTESARQLATGDFSAAARLEIQSQDEVGVLADAFKKMAGNLERTYAQLEDYNRDLARKIEERTQELAKMTVAAEEARRSAESANSAKSSFLASMSHELRTPLTSIIGFSELLYADAEADGRTEAMEDVTRVMDSARHLLNLINEILDLSKIEAQKMELHLERFPVAQVVKEVTNTITPLVKKRGNELVVDVDGDLGQTQSDLVKLRQSLLNLLSNANKFTEKGRVTIRVRRTTRDGTDWLSLAVCDTGIGMTPEQLGKLFQAFQQADSSTSRKFGGTGLGLVITKKFCELMGGTVTVTSELGKGSTFTLELPSEVKKPERSEKPEKPVAPTTPKPTASAVPAAPPAVLEALKQLPRPSESGIHHLAAQATTGPLVLVIDDDRNVHQLVERTLAPLGCRFRFATNGAEGYALARELRPAVITLDVDMPVQDGWATIAQIKSDPDLVSTPVVMMTMSSTDKDLGFTFGAAEFLAKPVQGAQLASILQRHINGVANGFVLVVDDDPAVRELLRRQLETARLGVLEAEHGHSALALIERTRPNLVICDLMMPEMDGFKFLTEFRRRPEWANIPVLVLSAKSLTAQEREFLAEHTQTLLAKDGGRGDLVEAVKHFLPTKN